MLLIGSRAAKYHFLDFREPKDYDFIASNKEVDNFLKNYKWKDTSSHNKKRRAKVWINNRPISFEFELIEHYHSSNYIYLNEYQHSKFDQILNIEYSIACPIILYLLKRSHITFNIHFWKNIQDYLYLSYKLSEKEKKFNKYIQLVFDMRFKEISDRVNKKQMNFNLDNSDFFQKSEKFVNRVVEHDSIHYATCFHDEPLFLMAKEDKSKAALSEDKVWGMSHNLIIQMIQEECMALSLERSIIPALMKSENYNAKLSYNKMAGKMVYNYLPPFLRLYAADHFLEFVNPPFDYVTTFLRRHPTFYNQLNSLRLSNNL